ncbi:GNAT family N-acetyltransferase [Streptomyces sp. NBC_00370]|uniref:GNAT family N-acetyltransferase n=1 Tax=Streptomyces sp. NBC_00370 TaxID=2975728 RepID=UPI002E26B041
MNGPGPTEVAIRVAEEADLDAAAELFRLYLDFYEVQPQDPDRPRAFIAERLKERDSLILLASASASEAGAGAGALGFAQVYPMISSLDMAPSWLLSDLYVPPAGRRRGVGRALVRDVVRRAREAGMSGVQLDTAYDNHTAQHLYEAEGFTRDPFHIYLHDLRRTDGHTT